MRELREGALSAEEVRLRDWAGLAPAAQETLIRAAAGTLSTSDGKAWSDQQVRSAVDAAKEILNRAIGTVAQQHEVKGAVGIVAYVLQAGSEHMDGNGAGSAAIGHQGEPLALTPAPASATPAPE